MKYATIPPGWKSMDSAPKDGSPILGWCLHKADPYTTDGGKTLTTYAAHCTTESNIICRHFLVK